MVIEGLLPVGSVVMLKEGSHRTMIIGYAQRMKDKPEAVFDYVGIMWPEGHTSPDATYCFNRDQVQTVYFLGYQTDGQQVLNARIEAALDALKAPKNDPKA